MENLNITIPKNFEEYYKNYSIGKEGCKENINRAKEVIETVLTDLERIKIYATEYTKIEDELDPKKLKLMIQQIENLLCNSSFAKTINTKDNNVEINISQIEIMHDFTTDEYYIEILINHKIVFRTDMKSIYYIKEKNIVKESINNPDYITIDSIYNDEYVSFDYFYVTKKMLLVHDKNSFREIKKENLDEILDSIQKSEFEEYKQKKLIKNAHLIEF